MKYDKKENLLKLAKAVTELHEFYFSINDENPWSDNEQQNWEDLDELMLLLSSAFQGFGIAFGWNGKELKKGFPDDLAKKQSNAPSILDDMKAQGFPDGPDWERYDYTTGGDGLESPTEYWTNKKTGISYQVEAEAVISHYAAEVYE